MSRFYVTTIAAITAVVMSASVSLSEPWRVLSAERIPSGATALTFGFGELWCGYEVEGDSVLRIINPDNGDVTAEHTPPEAHCQGMGFRAGAVWFLGAETIYRLNRNGEVAGEIEAPYEVMRGLAGTDDGFWTVANSGGLNYLVLFAPDGQELRRIRVYIDQHGDIAWDGENLWLTDPVEGYINKFNPAQQSTVALYPTPTSHPTGIAYSDGNIYLIDDGDDDETDVLYCIDPTGEPAPRLLPSARYYDFGLVSLGEARQWSLTLYNVGNLDMVVDSVRLAQGDAGFSLHGLRDSTVVDSGRSAVVNASFEPTEFGPYSDTILVATNDPFEGVVRIELVGIGVERHRKLAVSPGLIDFGRVRADPWRDGSRYVLVNLINQGVDDLRIDSLKVGIEDIFDLEKPRLPAMIATADTLPMEIWFTPHRGICYLDTLTIMSNDPICQTTLICIRGQGSDSVYADGTVLWWQHLEAGEDGFGSAARHTDITGDRIDEVVTVGPSGVVYCLNGFASDAADVIWQQDFAEHRYIPAGIFAEGCLTADRDLNGDCVGDIIFGSGAEDLAVYGINGYNGDLIWRWEGRSVGAQGPVFRMSADYDLNGDGVVDPVVLAGYPEGEQSRLCRLDGATGRAGWVRNLPAAGLLEPVPDLDHNGTVEFAAASQENLYIWGGADGGLIQLIDTSPYGELTKLAAIGDIDDDGTRDIVFSPREGGLFAYSLPEELELWRVDAEPPGDMYGRVTVLIARADAVALGTEEGFVLLIDNLLEGGYRWVSEADARVSALAFHPDRDGDEEPELLVGYETGLIECHSGTDGLMLWEFPGDDSGVGRIGRLEPFEDVDLGGGDDLLATCGDGVIRCISSGGDLPVGVGSSRNYTPFSPAVATLFPNPFNGQVRLEFTLPSRDLVTLTVWDLSGRRVSSRSIGPLPAGMNRITYNPFEKDGLTSGIYIFRISGDASYASGRGLLLK